MIIQKQLFNEKEMNGRVSYIHKGYTKIRVGLDHPLADKNGYAFLHHLVYNAAQAGRLPADKTVRHANKNRRDNRLTNLILVDKPRIF